MSLLSPSPDSSPILDPTPGDSSPTADPPSSSSDNPTDTPPPRPSPTDSSTTPPESSPAVAAPPPSDSEPQPSPTTVTPPPSPPSPTPPTSPPPSPLAPRPPSPPDAPPPAENPPAAPPVVPPPPPPESSPLPPDPLAPPPSPPAVSASPPPPPLPSDTSPPPSHLQPPEHSPPPPALPPPPATLPASPPSVVTPPNTTIDSPTSMPAASSPPSLSPPTPPATPPLPSIHTEKPTARSTTNNPNITTATASRDAGGIHSGGAIAIGLMGFLALSLVVFAVWFIHKRKKRRSAFKLGYMMPSPFTSSQISGSSFLRAQRSALGSANHSPYHSAQLSGSGSANNFMYPGDPGGMGSSRSWFTFEELAEATNSFSSNNLLGEGGFGCVYKGVLADGREVAVKQLKNGGGQGEREFKAEVEIISRIHHRHLVSLVGYCISDYQRLLVYEYVPNDTLHSHLHGEGRPVMTWATRFKVAAGAARGIAYLHEDCNPRIIHRDIKSANILLDNNFEARVADFGLAKLAQELESHTHVSTRVMGTFGYMAPEYATTGKLTEKSDVFSFGVVLLELITGCKPVDASRSLGDESLVEWARPLLARALEDEDFEDLVDPRLEKNYVESEMFRMIEAAVACVRHLASKRPRMSQVVRALDSIDEHSDLTNGMKPGQSQIFDARQQSAQIRMFQRMAFGSQDYGSDFFSNSQSSWRSGL